ncbi:hypothetical protein C8A03DRAFT_14946, partial [Achaetomium macrosporum]
GTYPLTGKTKPCHWAYFLETDSRGQQPKGIIFQLRGMPRGFYYPGPEREMNVTQEGEPPRGGGGLREKLEVGEVDGAEGVLDRIHEVMSEVEVAQDESSGWNCQNWALAGFEMLKGEGFVYPHPTAEGVESWLKERR